MKSDHATFTHNFVLREALGSPREMHRYLQTTCDWSAASWLECKSNRRDFGACELLLQKELAAEITADYAIHVRPSAACLDAGDRTVFIILRLTLISKCITVAFLDSFLTALVLDLMAVRLLAPHCDIISYTPGHSLLRYVFHGF